MSVSALSTLVVVGCLAAAVVAVVMGVRQAAPVPVRAKTPARRTSRVPGTMLAVSAIGWLGLAHMVMERNKLETEVADLTEAVGQLDQLPATAAGISPAFGSVTAGVPPTDTAKVATAAEELAEQPHSADFQRLRQGVMQRLFEHQDFDNPPQPVLIDLSQDADRETIKYLVEERPGLLTLIYRRDAEVGKPAIVYFPTAAGNQLVFTPVSGPGSDAVSALVNSALRQAGVQP